uniref:Methionyl-tRNA synthetase n=1 Tax=Nelumbo nucifera TaxID=4432 RepID=A0A822ZX18_NELNU|nr:TPA_asm: hypothetical protein HUJ06_017343 [Nelumbo nucifera]
MRFLVVCDKQETVFGKRQASGACPYCGGIVQAMDVESRYSFCGLPLWFIPRRKYICTVCARRLEVCLG